MLATENKTSQISSQVWLSMSSCEVKSWAWPREGFGLLGLGLVYGRGFESHHAPHSGPIAAGYFVIISRQQLTRPLTNLA